MIDPERLIEAITDDTVEDINSRYTEEQDQELDADLIRRVAIYTIDALSDHIYEMGNSVVGTCDCTAPITIETLRRGYCTTCLMELHVVKSKRIING